MARRITVALLCALLLLVPAGCGRTKTRLGSSPGNIANGGLIGGGSGWVYYRSEADQWRLYKARLDGSQKQMVADACPSYINVCGGWVYYSDYRQNFQMYRVRTNGRDLMRLTEERAIDINVVGDLIYYVTYGDDGQHHACSSTLDGSDRKQLTEQICHGLVYADGWLYFTSPAAGSFAIFRMKPDGTEVTQLNSTYSHFLNPVGDSVYYWSVDTSELRRLRTDGSGDTVLVDNGVDYVNAAGASVYFAKQADAYNIWRINTDGTKPEKLTQILPDDPDQPSHAPSAVYVVDGHVFYRGFVDDATGDGLFHVPTDGSGQTVWDARGR